MPATEMTERKRERIESNMPSCGPQSFTIAEFCAAHKISQTTFFKLKKAGKGPRCMSIGVGFRISVEAAAEWRRARENEVSAA